MTEKPWFTLLCAQCSVERAKEDFIVDGSLYKDEIPDVFRPGKTYYGIVCSKCRHANDPLAARRERDALLTKRAKVIQENRKSNFTRSVLPKKVSGLVPEETEATKRLRQLAAEIEEEQRMLNEH